MNYLKLPASDCWEFGMRLEEQPGISRHDLRYTGHQLQGKHLHRPVSSARSFDFFDARHVTASNCSSADRCDLATFEYICHQRFVGSSPPGDIEHTTCHQPVFILSLCFLRSFHTLQSIARYSGTWGLLSPTTKVNNLNYSRPTRPTPRVIPMV